MSRVQRVQDLRRANAAQPIPGKRHEPTVAQELADEDSVAVCVTHHRFVPCRGRGGCTISYAPADISAVHRYQSGQE